ncbi:MAG: tRNA pseudouridine(55) synthase TruB [Acidimicrobiia bacterium]|nr:tRNA pseudouridine(55) synthase TruB [Acidimicrobiia bacterium]
MSEGRDGFLLIDKERGWTSHDVVAKVCGVTGVKKAGHAGTLDPMATGLVVVGLGRATRLLRFVQDLPKEYMATLAFGVATDTLDADGAIMSREPMPVTIEEVTAVLSRFTGRIMQIPPMVSALRVDGRRLYELAREGKVVDRPPRPVQVYELDMVDFAPSDYPEATMRIVCGKGTYIRSLADDIAQALGGRAHLTSLRRTRAGSLEVDSSGHQIADLERAAAQGRLDGLIMDPAAGLVDLPSVEADEGTAAAVLHGMQFSASMFVVGTADDQPYRVLDQSGRLLAVYRISGPKAVAEVVLA